MLGTVLLWLAAAAAVVVLVRVRGWRGLLMLGACLLLVILGMIAWNVSRSA